jgi:hypothetical protein
MRVELDIFSGRPNPRWALDEVDVRHVLDRFAGRALARPDELPGRLGYRGLVLSTTSDDEHADELPSTFAVGGTIWPERMSGSATSLSVDETTDAARWLMSTAGDAITKEVTRHVEEVLAGTFVEKDHEGTTPDIEPPAPCEPRHMPFNPGFWNSDDVRASNNCYNYAIDLRTDTFAQPGRQCGHKHTELTCSSLQSAAECDGVCTACCEQNRLVAMVVWPGADYHFYRYHSDGFWGHKAGRGAVRNVDNCGDVIGGARNPANCCRGPYTEFCGYSWAPVEMRIR